MKDALGRDLKVGDHVAYRPPYSNNMVGGTVVKLTPKGATLGRQHSLLKPDPLTGYPVPTGETRVAKQSRDSSWIVLLEPPKESSNENAFFDL